MQMTKKGQIGKFEYWLVASRRWEVRKSGAVLAVKENMSDCVNAAKRLYDAEKIEIKA